MHLEDFSEKLNYMWCLKDETEYQIGRGHASLQSNETNKSNGTLKKTQKEIVTQLIFKQHSTV